MDEIYDTPASTPPQVSLTAGKAAAAGGGDLSFVQISDSHIGFSNAPNTDTPGTLREAVGLITRQKGSASLMLPRGDGLPDDVVAGHIRALQPGHLMDVASTDQHTVKPWFDGRLDVAPPVKDFQAEGFLLVGGGLDYLAGRPVAALVYQRRQRVIDLFVWPDGRHVDRSSVNSDRGGYNVLRWSRDGMAFWAVSDLSAQELADFARLWQVE